jgi:hypothetical protein
MQCETEHKNPSRTTSHLVTQSLSKSRATSPSSERSSTSFSLTTLPLLSLALTAFLALAAFSSITPSTGASHLDIERLFVLINHRTNLVSYKLGQLLSARDFNTVEHHSTTRLI